MPFFRYALLLVLALPAWAQDIEGSKDHPRVPRMPGYVIHDYVRHDFGKATFYQDEETEREVEGRYWLIAYEIAEGKKAAGPLEIARNYQQAFEKLGGRYYEGRLDNGGGQAYAWLPGEASGPLWMEIDVSNAGEMYQLTIVQQEPLRGVLEIGSGEIADALEKEGRISLYGIQFAFGKADITPESAKTLAAIAETLKAHPALHIEIQGHTDNIGGAGFNRTLSEARAAAVKEALTGGHGIEAARLSTAGFGDSRPLAPNDSEENRAKNRRVELVKKS